MVEGGGQGVAMALLPALLAAVVVAVQPGPVDDPVGVWPLRPEPAVVRPFDPPTSPYGAGHRGVDLLGSAGQPVLAALPGTVSWAGLLAGRGVVVVDHGTTRTTYEPVAAAVQVGAVVGSGDQLGTLQLGGSHCFPRTCLHWGWIQGETYLDPLRLVGAGPVRLLPLWRDDPVSRAPPASGRGYSISRTGSPPMLAVQVVKSVTVLGKVIVTENQQPPNVAGLQL
jgi:murein DD-endopeptidase MepM/ murein hydrolase activator NlpD